MDKYTVAEEAYKNGYEAGKKSAAPKRTGGFGSRRDLPSDPHTGLPQRACSARRRQSRSGV